MKRADGRSEKARWRALCLAGVLWLGGSRALVAPPQSEVDVSPEATPEIQQVKPDQATVGDEVTVTIEGRNFSRGVYVSFSNPSVRVVSTRRVSPAKLETKLAISKKAPGGAVSLYVSNPASAVAEAPFTIASAQGPAPAAPTAEIQPSESATPEVAAVEPPRAAAGSQVSLKITGKNFAKAAKVSFSNPGIRVLETSSAKSTELMARIQIAADASTGTTSLFVVNPGDREVEIPFEVAGGAPAAPTAPAKVTTASEPASTSAQRFEVYNLGDVVNILQNPNKPKGTLSVPAGKLIYEEGGKELFSAALADVKEIDVNTILGVNTGTFHILLNSGKTYNFVAASLCPADSQVIVDSLRKTPH